jgi:phage gp36-like protein
MGYTTQEQLEDAAGGAERFVQLADFDGDGAIDVAMVERAVEAATGFIDKHLRKFNAADLAALRASPTPTIAWIAAEETIFRLRSYRQQVSDDDWKLQEMRQKDLAGISADTLRVGDTKSARASFVENDTDITRDGTKGMW